MLDSLDTLIAFVVIMLVVSLLITIAVQMASALLNLRGLNLLNSLGSAFAVIAPPLEADRKELARYVLKGRLFSDSFLPRWFSWWRHATAIRPDELFDAIHRIAIGREPADDKIRNNARALLIALGVDETTIKSAPEKISGLPVEMTQLTEAKNKILGSLAKQAPAVAGGSDNAGREKDKALASLLGEILPQVEQAVNDAVKAIGDEMNAAAIAAAEKVAAAAGTIDSAYEKFQYWVRACEERAQQWLTMHARILTVVFAFVAAFGLQLDTVQIFQLVSSNKAVREKLVAQSAAIASQAEKTLGDSTTILQTSFSTWLTAHPEAKPAVGKMPVQPTDTRETVTQRLEAALASNPDKAALLNSFHATLDKTVADALQNHAHDYSTIKADFENTGFQLFPPNNQGRWGQRWSDGWQGHIWGVLFSVGLLSLGAPFWYNSLKNLTSLRSAVAQNISEEKKQQQPSAVVATATAPAPVKVPPTVK